MSFSSTCKPDNFLLMHVQSVLGIFKICLFITPPPQKKINRLLWDQHPYPQLFPQSQVSPQTLNGVSKFLRYFLPSYVQWLIYITYLYFNTVNKYKRLWNWNPTEVWIQRINFKLHAIHHVLINDIAGGNVLVVFICHFVCPQRQGSM